MEAFIMVFDPDNAQEEFQYMANALSDGRLVKGFVIVDMPWYLSKDQWEYYIVIPYFSHNRATMSFEKIKVQKDSIKPLTQINDIIYHQSLGESVEIIKLNPETAEEEILVTLSPDDNIPLNLWVQEDTKATEIPEKVEAVVEEAEPVEPEKPEKVQPVKKKGRPKKSAS